MERVDEITGVIIEEAMRVHRGLGPGLLESVYRVVLARALRGRGLGVEEHKAARFEFDGVVFDRGLRVDLLVEGLVVVELKSVEVLLPVHYRDCPENCVRGHNSQPPMREGSYGFRT